MKHVVILPLLALPLFVLAQNTIGGEAKIVPEAEVIRQSAFIDAERERLLEHYDKAVELYKIILYAEPENAAAWYALARCNGALKDEVAALDAAAKAVAADPENQWYQIYQADLLEKIGKVREAAAMYEALAKRYPQTTDFWQRLAYLSVLAGEPKAGLKALDQLEKVTGFTEEIAEKKHLIYLGLGDAKKAAAELQKLADAHPRNLRYRHRLAQFYEKLGDENAARKVYEDILRRDPDDPVAQLAVVPKSGSDLAYLQSLKTLFGDAGISLDAKIKELLPYFPKLEAGADPGLVQALLDLGKLVETTHPADAKAWSISGDLFYYADRPAEALERYRRCLQISPSVYSVWENTFSILHAEKNYEELFTLAEKAMDNFPNQASAYYYFGVAANEKGRPDEAIAQLEQALLMTSNKPALRLDVVDQIGVALLRKKDPAAAAARYEPFLTKGGDRHPGVLEHYGDALFQLGNRDQALQFWQKAQKLAPSPELEQKIATGKL